DRRRNDKIVLAEECLPAPIERGLQRERTRHVERGIAEPLGDVVANIGPHLVRMFLGELTVTPQKCDRAQYPEHLVGMAAVRMGPFETAECRSECRELLPERLGEGALRRRKSEIGCRCDPQAGEIDPWRIAIG